MEERQVIRIRPGAHRLLGLLCLLMGAGCLAHAQDTKTAEGQRKATVEEQLKAGEKGQAEALEREARGREANREQRADFERKMDEFRERNPLKDHQVDWGSSSDEDGRIVSGVIRYWQDGWITHVARFDDKGNTKGIELTSVGRSLQLMQGVKDKIRAEGGKLRVTSSAKNGFLGQDFYDNYYFESVRIYDESSRPRATLKFNEKGELYWSEYWDREGRPTGGTYDPKALPTLKDPGGPLQSVQAERFVTGICEPCRAEEERHNAIAAGMATLAADINNVAHLHKGESGAAQMPLRQRHQYLMKQWTAYKTELDALRKKLSAPPCSLPCQAPDSRIARFAPRPIAVCALQAPDAAAAQAVAKANNGSLASLTRLPSGVEAELRVPAAADPKQAAATCKALKGLGGNVTLIEEVPCGRMADPKPPAKPRARSVARNPIESKVDAGGSFAQPVVIDREHNADLQVQNFITATTRRWGAGDAAGPNVVRPNTNGTFVIPGRICAPPQPSLIDSIKAGSLRNVDYDRILSGVEYGRSGLSLVEKIIGLKYKKEDGVEIQPEEVLGLAEELNTLRGERFEKLGVVLEGITKNLERKQKVEEALGKLQEVADFIDLAERGREDPVVAAEALSKYLNLVGSIAGKVPGMGEFVQMYAQGVEGMVENLRFIQKRHNLTVLAVRDIEQFTAEFYGDLNKPAPAAAPSTAAPRERTLAEMKADADAQNRYQLTRAEAGALERAQSDLRLTERCIQNAQGRMAAIVDRGDALAAERQRLGNERNLEADWMYEIRLKAWYDGLVRDGKLPKDRNSVDRRLAEAIDRASRISDETIRQKRARLERFREIGRQLDRMRGELDKSGKAYEDCVKRLPAEQRAYLQALRAFVQKDTYLAGLSDNLTPQDAEARAREAAAKIPSDPPAAVTRVASAPDAGACPASTITVVTVCEGTNFRVPGTGSGTLAVAKDGESAAEWARRVNPSPIDFDKLNEYEEDPAARERELQEIDKQFGGR